MRGIDDFTAAMQPCFLRIVTKIDGVETVFSGKAEIRLTPFSARLHYTQEGGQVSVAVENGGVETRRDGDYLLRLRFEEGKTLPGKIGISGAEGDVETFTRRVGYSIREKSLMLSMKYALVFGGETQEVGLTLTARIADPTEEK